MAVFFRAFFIYGFWALCLGAGLFYSHAALAQMDAQDAEPLLGYEQDILDELEVEEEPPPPPAAAEDGFNIDPDTIPDEYLYEYKKVLYECNNDLSQSMYYNCTCYAMRFLEVRMEHEERLIANQITNRISKECRDATGAAGYEYNACLGKIEALTPGTDPEEYCACYANTFARFLDFYQPLLRSKPLVALKTRARIECNDRMAY